jgi:hypothetical protein
MVRLLATLMLAATAGCSLTMSAITNHNSRGTYCNESVAFGVIDLLASAGLVAAISSEDEHPGYYAIPGLLALTGLISVVSAERCRGGKADSNASPVVRTGDSAPSFGDAPVDPTARDATHEERFGVVPQPSSVRLFDSNGMPLQPPDPPSGSTGVVREPPLDTCTLAPRKECPEGYYCRLVAENTGTCTEIK